MIVHVLLLMAATMGLPGDPEPAVDYVRDVRPILSRLCLSCHGGDEGLQQLTHHAGF